MKLLIRVRYDGSFFNGSQVQPGLPTVQGTLCGAAGEIFGFPCSVTGCSRTDAGVHAYCYCAAVSPENENGPDDWCPVPEAKIGRAFNSKLPPSIAVTGASFVPDSFHPRYDVTSKEYVYVLSDSAVRDPFLSGRAWQTGRRVSESGFDKMKNASSCFIGKHDFRSFMASGSDVSDTVRDVKTLNVVRSPDGLIKISVRADGFLYNMVRIIVGTLLDVGYGRIDPSRVPGIIESRDRSLAGQTAPAEGLYLSDVEYNVPISWKFD